MKLFNRSKEAEEEAEAPLEEDAMEAAPEAGGSHDDIATILDASVKEISEKIARLSSSVESAHEERTGMEEKLLRMEERMRKLSSLTEMISSQYNPFLGDSPLEEEAPYAARTAAPPAAPPTFDFPGTEQMPAPPPAPEAPPAPEPADEPFHPAAEEAYPEEGLFGDPEPEAFEEAEAEEADATGTPRLPRVAPTFENSVLMLRWADTLLKAAQSRQGVQELLAYYERIGWVSAEVREQVLAYAEGLSAPTGKKDSEWRAHAEIHEHSLLFIEKLRGCGTRR